MPNSYKNASNQDMLILATLQYMVLCPTLTKILEQFLVQVQRR